MDQAVDECDALPALGKMVGQSEKARLVVILWNHGVKLLGVGGAGYWCAHGHRERSDRLNVNTGIAKIGIVNR